nr:rano class II histocompatibility antigen, A beta chain-like isoform X2 [Oncorhynchus nerka]
MHHGSLLGLLGDWMHHGSLLGLLGGWMHHGSLLGLLGGWMHHGSLLGLLGGWMHHGSLLGLLGGWMHHGSLLGLLGGWMHHGSLLGLLGDWMHHGSLLGLLGGWTFCHSDPGNTSRVQKYVGFGEFGICNADHYNSQAWKMAIRKAEVETICRYSARFFKLSTLERIVPPIVKARLTKPSRYGELSMLECSVLGFYPQEVRVSWLRDWLETTTAVISTDTLANGEWSYQLDSYLEFRPQRGERIPQAWMLNGLKWQ